MPCRAVRDRGGGRAGAGEVSDSVTFDAVVYKIQTTVDGAIRITLDLPESAIDAAAWLMECKRSETSLNVACVKNDYERKPEKRKAIA